MRKKIIIVGAGPIGLNLAIRASELGFNVVVFEQGSALGGQITSLYPEKEIYDIPGIAKIIAKNYVRLLSTKIGNMKTVSIIKESKVSAFLATKRAVSVLVNRKRFSADYLVLCCGLGYYAPRPLGLNNESTFTNISYSVLNPLEFADKNVVILGGGDSAIDWTREIARYANNVKIIHRRTEFRGDITPISNIRNVEIFTPFVVTELEGTKNCLREITINNLEDNRTRKISLDWLIVNYGSLPPQKDEFDIDYDGAFASVLDNFKTKHPRVFAIGDMTTYKDKSRRIAPGLVEIENLLDYIRKN